MQPSVCDAWAAMIWFCQAANVVSTSHTCFSRPTMSMPMALPAPPTSSGRPASRAARPRPSAAARSSDCTNQGSLRYSRILGFASSSADSAGSVPPVTMDFESSRASLASISIRRPRERTRGLNGRSERPCRRRFSRATALRCFSTCSAVLWAAESSLVVVRGSVVVWESWEAKKKMVMSISSLDRPPAACSIQLVRGSLMS
jgi:hypothetical protein